MANIKSNSNRQNSRKSNQECGIGMNFNGNSCKSKSMDKKRKRKLQHQLFTDEDDYRLRLQEVLYSPEHILTKIFRKDGPALGNEFDSLPSNAFLCNKKGPRKCHHTSEENLQVYERRKAVCENSVPTLQHGMGKGLMTDTGAPAKKNGRSKGLISQKGAPVKKHGIGKGLMRVWQMTNTGGREFPSYGISRESLIQQKKNSYQQRQNILRKLSNKEQAKRKLPLRNRKVVYQKVEKRNCKEKCELALDRERCLENSEHFAMLIDDEELELRELQAGPNPLTCSAHFTTNGSHGCSLCKDLLAKFPPNTVTMRPPFYVQPWDSSPELVKKLFKVFHFICTWAIKIDVRSFTLDEFAQAFHDKDSLLLGQVHVALLKLLLYDVEQDLSRGFLPHASKNRKFLALLHSVEVQDFVLGFWQKSLNLLTWTEILRQVLVAAGFGSKLGMAPKGALTKEVNLMAKYGLNSGTLKGELFSTLLTQGSSGMQVSELAKSSSIVELNLVDTIHDLENLIYSVLSSDITLFEKISSSGYRLRINATTKEEEACPSDCEDFGSVDEISAVSGGSNLADDSKSESMDSSPARVKQDHCKNKNNMLTVYNEIDESHPGEAWLLGLMEGEYSDLSIEEKLNALAALTDLLSAGSSIRTEDFLTPILNVECSPNINHYASGGKIKRSTVKQCKPGLIVGGGRQMASNNDVSTSEQPIDSLVPMSKIGSKGKDCNTRKDAKEMKTEEYLHPMQSIFLGSDRRYNRYWIFLGPCDEFDPGHKRIYFESSEDGHWEVIDTQEALCTLLLTLDRRGAREARLLASLEKQRAFLCQAMSSMPNAGRIRQLTIFDQSEPNTSREDSSSPVSDVDNQLSLCEMQNDLPSSTVAIVPEAGKKGEQKDQWSCSQAFGSWIWNSFYLELNSVKNGKRSYSDSLRRCEHCHDLYWRDEKHCVVCHTTFELDFDLEERYAVHSAICQDSTNINNVHKQRVLSSQLQALKAAIYAIETVLPDDAFLGPWKRSAHNLWINRLRRTSSLAEFLQVLADFISAINEDWFYQLNDDLSPNYLLDQIFTSFPSMPQTSSAVALWLVKLDLLVAPYIKRAQAKNKSRYVN
ncbi:homeobox-DDT domain protein RLT3-like [Olea europaea var. sylvestris]|uniref:homeobox-DDT domain protein RLT3-like n=1 Tax=Olea europaea var. sylvestris TaxID=158386 RepID=UPI000C1D5D4A|nr:homeobox-DDT domain protein RLT3-like [Olea europaea var. sylvestris]